MHRFCCSPSYPGYGTCYDGHHQQDNRRVLYIDSYEVPVDEKPVEKKPAYAEKYQC